MSRRIAVAFFLVGALFFSSNLALSRTVPQEVAIKSVSLFNLQRGVPEEELVTALREVNRVIRDSGHPDAGYILWRVRESEVGGTPPIGRRYIMVGNWPSQDAYDRIHADAAYQEAGNRYAHIFTAPNESRLYSRYEALDVGGPAAR